MLLGNRAKTCNFSSAGSSFCKLEPGPSPLRSWIPAFRKRNAFFWCGFVCLFVLRNPESWALVSGVQLKDSKFPLSTGIRSPLEYGIHYLRSPSGIWRRMESSIHDCLGFNRTWGSVYSKNVRTMCAQIKRLLDSDARGGTLKEEGGGSKNFLLLKKRENFDPWQNYTQNSDILRKNPLTILLFTYHSLQIKFVISWRGWQPKCHAIRRATKLATKGMQRGKDRNRFAKKKVQIFAYAQGRKNCDRQEYALNLVRAIFSHPHANWSKRGPRRIWSKYVWRFFAFEMAGGKGLICWAKRRKLGNSIRTNSRPMSRSDS